MLSDRSQPWHVATVTQGGRPTFAHFAAGAAVGCELALMRVAGLWDVLVWVLLPCRLDVVIAPLRGALGDTVPRFLARAAARVAHSTNDPRPVWADRFAWRPLYEEGQAEALSRMLLQKPLRAELVERLADYPFWDSAWLGAPARVSMPAHDPLQARAPPPARAPLPARAPVPVRASVPAPSGAARSVAVP